MNAFNKVKELITSTPGPMLAYFDIQKVTTLQCEAPKYGLGATLMQEANPIAFASESLTLEWSSVRTNGKGYARYHL